MKFNRLFFALSFLLLLTHCQSPSDQIKKAFDKVDKSLEKSNSGLNNSIDGLYSTINSVRQKNEPLALKADTIYFITKQAINYIDSLKTAKKSLEIVREIPKDLFLAETDSPYMTPEPYRMETNNSNNLKYIISKIADIKGMSFEEVEVLTTENTKRLFKKMV